MEELTFAAVTQLLESISDAKNKILPVNEKYEYFLITNTDSKRMVCQSLTDSSVTCNTVSNCITLACLEDLKTLFTLHPVAIYFIPDFSELSHCFNLKTFDELLICLLPALSMKCVIVTDFLRSNIKVK